jgi:hypothetical protein
MAGLRRLELEGGHWNKSKKLWETDLYGSYCTRDEAADAVELKMKTNQAVTKRPRREKVSHFILGGGCMVAKWYLCQKWVK